MTAPSKTTLVAIASLALGVGCSGDASVESAEEETTTGGEAEASCSVEGSSAGEAAGDSASQDTASQDTASQDTASQDTASQDTAAEGMDDSSAGDAEASCGEGSCG